jgi:tetratricopeptide (TPR) repeat protein
MSDNVLYFPNLIQLYMKKVTIAIEEEDYAEAIELLEKILEFEPEHEEARQLLTALEQIHQEQMKKASVADDAQLEEWKLELLQEDAARQWSAFEKMYDFTNEKVKGLIQTFLEYPKGDLLLKTKVLQECRKQCPGSWKFTVHKQGHTSEVKVEEVPLQLSEWAEPMRRPLTLLDEAAHQEPSLLELAKETWLYVLEKYYPNMPEIDEANCWTAGLHSYTLKVLNGNHSSAQLQKLEQYYQMSRSQILDCERHFEQHLIAATLD